MNSNPATKNTGRRTVTLRLEDAGAKKLRILATVNGQTVNHILLLVGIWYITARFRRMKYHFNLFAVG